MDEQGNHFSVVSCGKLALIFCISQDWKGLETIILIVPVKFKAVCFTLNAWKEDEENENDPLKKKKKKPESFTSMMMKAEISSAAAEEEKAKKLKERMDKIQAAKAEREKKNKKRIVNKSDRLLDDKVNNFLCPNFF